MNDKKKLTVTEHPLDGLVGRFRKFLARQLAKTALRLDPECPEVARFFAKQMFDMAVYGNAVSHINFRNFVQPPNAALTGEQKE